MEENQAVQGERAWTLGDTVREILHKSRGPLLALVGAGGAVAVHHYTDPGSMGKLGVYMVRGVTDLCAVRLIYQGFRDVRFYSSLYKTVHHNLEKQRQGRQPV